MGNKHRIMGSERWKLPIRVIALATIIILIAFWGMESQRGNLKQIKAEYSELVHVSYFNKEKLGDIVDYTHHHEAYIYEYQAVFPDAEKTAIAKGHADETRAKIEDLFKEIKDTIVGGPYEEKYNICLDFVSSYFADTEEYFGLKDEESLNKHIDNRLHGAMELAFKHIKELDNAITSDANRQNEMLIKRLEGYQFTGRFLLMIIAAIALMGFVHSIFLTLDIVNRDPQTQVPNLGMIGREFRKMKKRGKLNNYACICTNIKRMSLVNQRFGTPIGDMVLKSYTQQIQKQLGKDEKMARIGGDNFLYLVKAEHVDKFVDALSNIDIEIQTDMGPRVIKLENRCGIYMVDENSEFDMIMDAAFIAMNQAKKAGGGEDVLRFDKQILNRVFNRKNLIRQYKTAIQNKEFVVVYQPKVDSEKMTLCGGEALVRWNQNGKLLSPIAFIPVLENEGSIVELDFYVFDRVCQDIRNWLDSGIKAVRLSSNFSKQHLRDNDFAAKILETVNKYNIPRHLIEIEITESSALDNPAALKSFVAEMNANNIAVSIDDFGTGYSSLSMLRDVNIDVVKIDKSFVDRVCSGDQTTEKLVENIIKMLKDLNREIICEGVETKEQCDFLRDKDCCLIQGYYFDRPLPHDEFQTRLTAPKYAGK